MAFQPANCIKVELKWRHETTDLHWRNILHVGPQAAPISQADADMIGAAINGAFAGVSNMFSNMDAEVVTEGCQVSWLGVEGAPQFDVLEPADKGGAAVGRCLPLNVAVCVTIRTTLNTRNGRGRIYTSGISDTALDDGRVNSLSSVAAGNFQVTWDQVRNRIDANTPWQLGVLSRYDGVDPDGRPIPRAAGLFTPATQIVNTNTRLDSMRSRLKTAS